MVSGQHLVESPFVGQDFLGSAEGSSDQGVAVGRQAGAGGAQPVPELEGQHLPVAAFGSFEGRWLRVPLRWMSGFRHRVRLRQIGGFRRLGVPGRRGFFFFFFLSFCSFSFRTAHASFSFWPRHGGARRQCRLEAFGFSELRHLRLHISELLFQTLLGLAQADQFLIRNDGVVGRPPRPPWRQLKAAT